jgi:hypothetical protein
MEPGNRKSPVFGDATEPLRALEDEMIERATPAFAREMSDRRTEEGRLKKLERQGKQTHEARQLAEKLANTTALS